MAVETVRVCDFGGGGCKQPAVEYRVWREGDRQAHALDLCDTHAAPLLELIRAAKTVPLPIKPRVAMAATKLKTTPATRPLKK